VTTTTATAPLAPASTTELTARVTGIVWAADDGTAVIAKVRVEGGPNDRLEVCVKGQTDPDSGLPLHLPFRFSGEWHKHEKHGLQFHFSSYAKIVPHDRRGVVAYLVSLVDGVGEVRAHKLYDAFKGDAVRVLREEPARVVEAGIMREEAAAEASQTLHDEAAFESVRIDLLSLFAGRGFQHQKLIRACIKTFGRKAPWMVRQNPYLLMIHGFPSAGFKRCDKLFLDLKGKPDKLKRQTLCAWYALKMDSSGHTWHRKEYAIQAVEKAMPLGKAKAEKAIRLGVRAGWLAESRGCIAERAKARNEETVAREVLRLSKGGMAS
jgi:exodeoxyribonuclease V alpha subunit